MGATESRTTFANQGEVAQLTDNLTDRQRSQQADLESLEQTRQSLEDRAVDEDPEPETDDETLADYDPADADLEEIGLDVLAAGYPFEPDFRAGSSKITFDGETIIGVASPKMKPGTAMVDWLNLIDQTPGIPFATLSEYLANTLAAWSLSEEYDADYWEDEITYNEGIDLVKQVALGGNRRTR